MKIHTFLFVLFAAFMLFSCKKEIVNPVENNTNQSADTINTTENTNPNTAILKLSEMDKFPTEIEGCSCALAETREKLENQKFWFVSDFEELAYISINNQKVALKLVSTTKEEATFGDHDHIDIYEGENFKVTVEYDYQQASDQELMDFIGKITVETAGNSLTKDFHGWCGC